MRGQRAFSTTPPKRKHTLVCVRPWVHETIASMIRYDGEGHLFKVPDACEKRVLRFFKSSPSSGRMDVLLTVGQGITKLVDMAR